MRFVLLCLAIGLCCLPFDVALSRWLINDGLSGDIRALFQRVESFGHTYGLICIAITIWLLDPQRRRELPRVIWAFAAAGLTADLIKLQVWRMRPRGFLELAGEGNGLGFVGTAWSGWNWEIASDHTYHSFPSAHTACAVAFAIHLGRLYPAGRVWFRVLAALCAMNRIDGGAHFASDVFWGAAVGYLVAVSVPDPIAFFSGCSQAISRWRRWAVWGGNAPVAAEGLTKTEALPKTLAR